MTKFKTIIVLVLCFLTLIGCDEKAQPQTQANVIDMDGDNKQDIIFAVAVRHSFQRGDDYIFCKKYLGNGEFGEVTFMYSRIGRTEENTPGPYIPREYVKGYDAKRGDSRRTKYLKDLVTQVRDGFMQ